MRFRQHLAHVRANLCALRGRRLPSTRIDARMSEAVAGLPERTERCRRWSRVLPLVSRREWERVAKPRTLAHRNMYLNPFDTSKSFSYDRSQLNRVRICESSATRQGAESRGPEREAMARQSRSVDRALQLLVLIAGAGRPLRFAELQRLTDVPKGSLHSLLTSLTVNGFLKSSAAGFTVGIAAFEVGTAVPVLSSMKAVADSTLEQLRQITQESCNFGTLEGGDVLYLNGRDANHDLRTVVRIGERKRAYGTGLGKAMLALLSDEEIVALYDEEQLVRMTRRTLGTRSELLEDLAVCRARDYALEQEESTPGVGCIGMATRAPDGRPYGISITAPVHRVAMKELKEMQPLLAEAVNDIEKAMAVSSWFGAVQRPAPGDDQR